MVAPSAFPKEGVTSSPLGKTSVNAPTQGRPEQGQPETVSEKCKPRKFPLGIIMNPAVLSIISHFPNKCIPKKTEKYVVNGLTLSTTTLPLGSPNDLDTKSDSTSSNSSAKPGKTKSTSRLKRYAGLLLAILSSIMFSLTGLIVKLLPHHHPLTQGTWMFFVTFILVIPLNLAKYVFTCMVKESQQMRKSSSFRQIPDNIEPVANVDEPEESENNEPGKVQSNLPLPPASDLVSSTQNKLDLKKKQERRRKIKLTVLSLVRACAGCSGMVLYFYSLTYLNIGDALVIVCSTPVFVSIIGYLFLGESCGVIPVLTIIMSMVGVAVITRPPMLTGGESFQADDMIGAGLAFSSMLCIAMAIVTMRNLQDVYHGLLNLIFAGWGTIQTMIVALFVGVLAGPKDWQDGVLMVATGVLFFLGQTFLTLALQFEEAGPVALVRTSEVVFAFVWQFVFLHQSPDWFSISGAALILAGIFLIISRKWIASMPEDSPGRKMFGFLLR